MRKDDEPILLSTCDVGRYPNLPWDNIRQISAEVLPASGRGIVLLGVLHYFTKKHKDDLLAAASLVYEAANAALYSSIATRRNLVDGQPLVYQPYVCSAGSYGITATYFHEAQGGWVKLHDDDDFIYPLKQDLTDEELQNKMPAKDVPYTDSGARMSQRKEQLQKYFSPAFAEMLVLSWLLEESDLHLGQFCHRMVDGVHEFLRFDFDLANIVAQTQQGYVLNPNYQCNDSSIYQVCAKTIDEFPFLPTNVQNWPTTRIAEFRTYATYCQSPQATAVERAMVTVFYQAINDTFVHVSRMCYEDLYKAIPREIKEEFRMELVTQFFDEKVLPLRQYFSEHPVIAAVKIIQNLPPVQTPVTPPSAQSSPVRPLTRSANAWRPRFMSRSAEAAVPQCDSSASANNDGRRFGLSHSGK